MLGGILIGIGGIAMLVCWIMVLIQLFKKEGTGLGILGILCWIYAYIWGWIKSKELGLKNIMLIWTVSFALYILGYILFAKAALESPELQKLMQDAQQAGERGVVPPAAP